ncbi:hypothetical protein HK101_011322 [Irineochytrium annulatum]|nr:hypothetical protein HK101_011322 [Irineochytrium annulatum]
MGDQSRETGPFLTVVDSATGKSIRVPISDEGTIPASLFTQIRLKPTTPPSAVNDDDTVPLRLFDPGFKNTVVCRSKISLVDGDSGNLFYRGYDVATLVEKSSFLEVAYLLAYGELPTKSQLERWTRSVMMHTYVHTEIEKQMLTFRYDAHPMGMLISTIASLSTFHPDANPALKGDGLYMKPKVPAGREPTAEEAKKIAGVREARDRAIFRMLGKVPTIASNAYRHRIGRPYNAPMPGSLNYAENLLYMMDKLNETEYKPDERLVRLLDKMFILLAEHGSNCSTVTMRHLASSGVDPYTALAGAAGALFGERKSGAVIDMLRNIGKVENIQVFLSVVKRRQTLYGKSETGALLTSMPGVASPTASGRQKPTRLMGFGHRIYKTHDPRVKICKAIALELFGLMGTGEMGELALALEDAALKDEWFVKRGLFPNIDFWSAIVFHTLGFPSDMFPVLMCIPRVAGFMAHWQESLDDPEYKIFRPRQNYVGEFYRDIELISDRAPAPAAPSLESYVGRDPLAAKRRTAADEAGLSELNEMIFDTQRSIAELNAKMALKGKEPETEEPAAEDDMASRLAIGPVSSWVVKRLFASQEPAKGADAMRRSSNRISKTQGELQALLEQQQQLLAKVAELNTHDEEDKSPKPVPSLQGSQGSSPKKEPNLLAGSKSPRVLASRLKK